MEKDRLSIFQPRLTSDYNGEVFARIGARRRHFSPTRPHRSLNKWMRLQCSSHHLLSSKVSAIVYIVYIFKMLYK